MALIISVNFSIFIPILSLPSAPQQKAKGRETVPSRALAK